MWKKILRNPYLSMMSLAWYYARERKNVYLMVYTMFIFSNLADAAIPVIWGLFINELQEKGVNALQSAWMYAGAYLGIQLLSWSFHGTARIRERNLAFILSRNYLQELYHKTLHLPVKWHQDHHSGATINRVRKAYEGLKDFFENGFIYVHALGKFTFSFAAMLYFAPKFGLVAVALGLLAVYVILRFDKPFLKALNETNEKEHIVSSTLFDSLSNILTVITLRLEKRMESGLLQKIMDVFPPFRRKAWVNEWKWFTVDMIVHSIYAIIIVGYVFENWKPGQVFLIGGLVTLVTYVERFTSVFHDIAWQYTEIVRHHANVQSARDILEAYDSSHRPEEAAALPPHWKSIEIRNLSFHYEDQEGRLRGINRIHLSLQRGQRIALIGESGSGKSTLLAVLRGLYLPEQGASVHIDEALEIQLDMISSHVTLFPQEPEIFENTIAYNITLGLPFASEEITRVCETARFSDVIEQLPQGLHSNIQEKGVNLSGGQKQRLALARGILAARDSDLILLDEPTSSVDPKTELQIYQKLFEGFQDKVMISSLHRLHLLPQFDYVYLMDQGNIIAEGSFEYLRTHSPAFQEMWRHQEELRRAGEQPPPVTS
ncbi:MAG: ABC transporter ATP-binding protein [Haliscomenobacter sp.]